MYHQNFQRKESRTCYFDNPIPASHSLDRLRPFQLTIQPQLLPEDKYRQAQNPLTSRNIHTISKVQYKKQIKGLQLTTSRKRAPPRERLITQMIVEQQEDPFLVMELHKLRQDKNDVIRRLMQAENHNKELQFALEMDRKNRNSTKSEFSPPIEKKVQESHQYHQYQQLMFQLQQKNRENDDLRQQLKRKEGNELNLIKNEENNNKHIVSLRGEVEEWKNLFAEQERKNETLRKEGEDKEKILLMVKSENESIKINSTVLINSLTSELQKITQQKHEMSNQLFQQKNQKLMVEQTLIALRQEDIDLKSRVSSLTEDIENRTKDIDFLNNQSYTLDQSFQNALAEIDLLKKKLEEKEVYSSAKETAPLREIIKGQKIKISIFEEQIQKLTLTVLDFKEKHEQLLKKVSQTTLNFDKFQEQYRQIDKLKLHLTSLIQKQSQKQQPQVQNAETLDNISAMAEALKAQNERLRQSFERIQTNQKILLRQLEWLKKEKEESLSQQELLYKEQLQLSQTGFENFKKETEVEQKKKSEEIEALRACIKEMQLSQPNREELDDSKSSLDVLAKNKLQLELKLVEQVEQNEKLNLQSQLLKSQMKSSQKNHELEIEKLNSRFQLQLLAKSEQYNNLHNEYRSEVQNLTKGIAIQRQSFSQHHSEHNMNKILKIDRQQSEDEFVSPPSSAVAKFEAEEDKPASEKDEEVIELL